MIHLLQQQQYFNASLQDIADSEGVSQQRIDQIIKRAIEKIHETPDIELLKTFLN